MMSSLKFIIGEIGCGKTYRMTEMIRRDAQNGIAAVLIVPEQFSSSAEHKLYNALGISLYNRIHVETFTRIRKSILKKNRGVGGRIPNETERAAIMYTVRRELANAELKHFSGQIKNPAFTSACLKIVRELEMNGITSKELSAEKISDRGLSDKLSDISAICEAYDMRLTECGYKSSLSDGEEIAKKAAETGFFKGMHIYIDGFKSFTADQLRLMDIMKAQGSLTVCLPTPYDKPNSSPVFSTVNETMADIIGDDSPEIIRIDSETDRFSSSPDLRTLGRSILRDEEPKVFSAEHLHIAEAPDSYSEADYVCSEISRQVRTGRYKYSDIAVLSRDFEDIGPILEDSFRRYDIPYFIDSPCSAASTPLVIFVMTLLEIASSANPTTEMLLRFLKTGFTPVDELHISELENYCTEHGIVKESSGDIIEKYSQYDGMYEKLVSFDNGQDDELRKMFDDLADDSAVEAARIGIIKAAVLIPLMRFRDSCGKSGTLKDITEKLCDTLNMFGSADKSAENADESSAEGREAVRIRNALIRTMQSLSETALTESSDCFTLKEYRELFGIIASDVKLYSPAHAINCVTAASADRARLDSPKVVYIMSAVSGYFPYKVTESGIFSEKELEILERSLNIKFNERLFRMTAEENFIAVSAVSAPSEELFITYSLSDAAGKPRYTSPLTDSIIAMTGIKPTLISELGAECFITTPKSAYSEYVRTLGKAGELSPEKAAAAAAVYGSEVSDIMLAAERYSRNIYSGNLLKHRISEDAAMAVYTGKNGALNVSASRIEDYAKCPFMFFCKKGLNLQNIKKYEYSSNIRGNTVHYVLSSFLAEILAEAEKKQVSFNEHFSSIPKKALKDRIHFHMEQYFKSEFADKGFETTPSFLSTFRRQEDVLLEILLHMQEEFSPENSKFSPAEFEFSIGRSFGKQEDMKPWKLYITSENGKMIPVLFSGSVDRIDVFTDRSSGEDVRYIRVIDYKTGSKSFKFGDILDGINMQMLLYLFAVTDCDTDSRYKDSSPAGVMYSPSSAASFEKDKNGRRFSGDPEAHLKAAIDEHLKMNGITIGSTNAIRAMEYNAEGKYIPQTLNTPRTREYLSSLAADMKTSSQCGRLIADFCTDIDKTSDTDIAAAVCSAVCENNSGIICGKLGNEYKASAEELIGKCSSLSSDSAFTKTAAVFLNAYGIFTRFNEYSPGNDDIRQSIEDSLTEKSGKKPFPDPEFALTEDEYENIRKFTVGKLKEICSEICSGNASAQPLNSAKPCNFCDYRSVCENCVPAPESYKRSRSGDKDAVKMIRKGDTK
ncbi:MAG: PD-(D/E)XK nuclease family protein [Oscillospiraceae bacterium]|nr:PD-(D/E)XK nuclease family protein [Oscillospiraceae bacterium]